MNSESNLFNHENFESATWESAQPEEYRDLLVRIRRIKNLDPLKAIGKYIFESGNLDHGQSGVFWYEYGRAKEKIKTIRANIHEQFRI